VREEDAMDRSRKRRAALAATLGAALAAACGGGGGGGAPAPGPGPAAEPALATDDDVGAWMDEAALIVVTDRCAGTRSLQVDGPGGRLRLDEDDGIAAAPGGDGCRVEERFEDEEDGS
jgi:hypothetical protein